MDSEYRQEEKLRDSDEALGSIMGLNAKRTTEEMIRKYGIGIIQPAYREGFKRENPKWEEWDNYYKLPWKEKVKCQ